MLTPAPSCAQASCHSAEPIDATAPFHPLWLLLESRAPFGAQATKDFALPRPLREALDRSFKPRGGRLQLIRRPDRRSGPLRGYLACVDPPGLVRFEYETLEEISSEGLEAWLEGALRDPLRVHPRAVVADEEYLALVCTNGRRDPCCAREGMPVYTRLAEVCEATPTTRGTPTISVWQTTHLGGHRFAPTLVFLPSGRCYGRVRPEEAVPLLTAETTDSLFRPAERLRGEVGLPGPVQAALAYERRIAEPWSAAVKCERPKWRLVEHPDQGATVTIVHDESRIASYAVTRETAVAPPRPPSCGDEPEPFERWIVAPKGHGA